MISIIKRLVGLILRPALHKPDLLAPYIVLGSEYGSWPLLTQHTGANSIIYSFGLGQDISFDLAAIERYRCRVFGFDPTPKSKAWLDAQSLPEEFTFLPVGIAAEDGVAEFFAPALDEHVSFSITPAKARSRGPAVKAPVMRLQTIISQLCFPPPDILKMDIEGFEYDVIDDILSTSLRPQQLLVEFHHGVYEGIGKAKTNRAVTALRDAGYRLFFVSGSGREYGFTRV